MRLTTIRIMIAVTLIVALASSAGTLADRARRSHCAAIGYELRARAAAKAADIKAFAARNGPSAKNAATTKQWQVYLDHIDAMGKVLVDTFGDAQPPLADDRARAQDMELVPLSHAGEACTGP